MEKYLKEEPQQQPGSSSQKQQQGLANNNCAGLVMTSQTPTDNINNDLSLPPWDFFKNQVKMETIEEILNDVTNNNSGSQAPSEDTDSEDRLSLDDLNIWDRTTTPALSVSCQQQQQQLVLPNGCDSFGNSFPALAPVVIPSNFPPRLPVSAAAFSCDNSLSSTIQTKNVIPSSGSSLTSAAALKIYFYVVAR